MVPKIALPGYTGSRSLYGDERARCQDPGWRSYHVVATDDHIMPQTKEAISHAMAAEYHQFWINKLIKMVLILRESNRNWHPWISWIEDWEVLINPQDISAKRASMLINCWKKVLLQAEMLELKANPKGSHRSCHWSIIGQRGRVMWPKCWYKPGTLNIGDPLWLAHTAVRSKPCSTKRVKTQIGRPVDTGSALGLSGFTSGGEKNSEKPTTKAGCTSNRCQTFTNRKGTIQQGF